MIDKLEFYHGAAIIKIVDDLRFTHIRKHELGYVINGNRLLILKYRTKAYSPWRFTVTDEDQHRIDQFFGEFKLCVVGLICGGDGICAISLHQFKTLLGNDAGWISAKRHFNGCYAVNGSRGKLDRKVAINNWPAVLFEEPESDEILGTEISSCRYSGPEHS